MIAKQPARKLFFALWPDQEAREALVRLQQPVRGRLIPPEKLHLTMAFLGQQPADALPVLLGILETMPVTELRLVVDCYGYFRRPQIAWAGPSEPPAALMELQAGLMEKLVTAGFSAATHGEFKPHITLAREAKEAPEVFVFDPVAWNVSGLSLVESMPDGRYVPIAQTR